MIHPLFETLPADATALMAQNAIARTIVAGQALFHEGDAADQLLVILEGKVKIWRTSPAGTIMVLHRMGPGGVPGCVAVFRRVPYPATATAVCDSRLLAWPVEFVARAMQAYPALAANALAIVGSRNADMLDRLQELIADPVERRVAKALMRLRSDTDGPETIIASRQDLAEMAATTLHTVSRCIGRWERSGIVRGGRGRLTILDAAGLAGLAGG